MLPFQYNPPPTTSNNQNQHTFPPNLLPRQQQPQQPPNPLHPFHTNGDPDYGSNRSSNEPTPSPPPQPRTHLPPQATIYTSPSPPFSTINIKISSPLHITGNNNVSAVEPGAAAAQIAMGVTDALKQFTIAENGVPMIDEEGRPRLITVDVKAEVRVEGDGNFVGEKAVAVLEMAKTEEEGTEGEERGKKRLRSE